MLTRRALLQAGLAVPVACSPLLSTPALAMASRRSDPVTLAKAALERHASRIRHQDVVGIADFSHSSRAARFLLVDMESGRITRHLVSHGRGSDPAHSGWLRHFSNEPGSNASSEGTYLTGQHYVGRHGKSQRLHGLERANSNAEARAIVIHGAWYVSDEMARRHGKVGRSEGCFAFSDKSLDEVLNRLGPGRMLLAGRLNVA